MAIQKRFIHFKKFSDFNSKKLSANEANTQYTVGISGATQDGEPDILYQSYVWIKDTKQQWTHGQLYDGSSDTYTTEFTVSDLFSISEDSPLTINKEALVNAVLSDKIIIIPYQDNKGSYVVSVDAFDEEIYFNLHFHDNSLSFVIYPNTSNNEITVDDLFTVFLQKALTSGENIRTINGESIIGDGSDLELATKEELNAKADDSSVVHTEGDEIIRGTKTFYAGPKFLSSGDANAIKFGTDTRINVDNLDGTTNTILGFIRQQFIVNSQSYPLYLNGQQKRPKYNNFEELALLSDVNNAINNINQTIEENEEVVAAALCDLNTKTQILDSEYFKTFETEEEYITAKESELLDPSCVVYISSEDRFIFPKNDDGSYNAIITISENYMYLSSQLPEQGVILINPSYLDLLEIDGEDYLSKVSYIEGLGECVKLEDVKLGDVFHVRFKLRDDLSVIMDPEGDGMDVGLFYASLSYLEVDESLFKATMKDTSIKVPISFLMSSVGPEMTYRFVGDCLFQDTTYFPYFIQTAIYIIGMLSSTSGIKGHITFQIPENNNTYGNIEDTPETWTEGSPIFCALINSYISEYASSEDDSLVINLETY